MINLTSINNTDLTIKEYKGQRVVTFKDIDTVHQRPEGTADRNFRKNIDKFIVNEDYFKIVKNQNNDIRGLEIPNRGLVLLTETGYLMLVKSFTDDLAWKVQRELVNTYFRVKKEPKQLKLEEKPYKYIPKLYKGEPVVTAADLEHFTGINRSNFSYYRKKYARRFQIGVDFWYLNGEALRDFKEETHINPLTNCLILYSKSGVMKLSKIMSGVPAELPCLCYEEQDKEKEDYYWTRNDMHDFFDKTKELITAVQVIMELIDRYNTPLEHKNYMVSLERFIQELNNRLLTIKTFSLYDMNGECEIMELKKEKTIPEQEKYLESLKGQFNPSKDIALNFKGVNKDKIVTLF